MLKVVFFDVDGTLVDSNQFHVLAWAEAFRSEGHEVRFADLHAQIGKGADNYVTAILPDANTDEIDRLGAGHRRLFKQHYMSRLRPLPDAQALLRRCREEGLRTYLTTSASGEEVHHHLDLLGARDLLDGWVDADEVKRSKPCPDLYTAALKLAGVRSEEAIAVGDTPYDIEAASGAGVATIAVRSGLFPDDALAQATAIYDDVGDLLRQFADSPLGRRRA